MEVKQRHLSISNFSFMKRFVFQFCIWISIAFVLAVVADYIITTGLKKTDIRKYSTWNDIYKGGLDADLLVLGSSQAWCGYNTFILDSVLNLNSYNLGFDGHPLDYQIIRYNTYRRFSSKPKAILINTVFLGTLGVTADEQYEREQFFPYITDDTLISSVADVKKITWFDRNLPLYRYFGYREDFENGISSFFGKTQFFYGGMHKGFNSKNDKWNQGSVLPKDTLITISIADKSEAVCMLDSFTRESCQEGIKVVFVKSPIYYPLRAKFYNIGQVDSIYESISQKYGIPILDYSFSTIAMDSGCFVNPTHLNKKGAELFTFKLCHDLDSIGIMKW